MPTLIGLPYSPWTEKARWALEVREIPYTFVHYQPLVGEPALRRKLRRWSGPVSVPVLTDDDGHTHGDSTAIARWASTRGRGPTLFPTADEARTRVLIDLSERALAAGRTLALLRTLENEEALREMIPKGLRGVLGPLAVHVGALGVRRTYRKYDGHRATRSEHEQAFSARLEEIRRALAAAPEGSPRLLLGALSFADIAIAQALGFVRPPAFGIRIGRASRESFGDPVLAERFADLLAWRDALYEAHRPRPDR